MFFSHRGQLSKLIMMILMQITCGLWRPTAQTYENIVILHRDWLSWVLIYTRPCCKVHRTNIFPAPLHPPHTHPLGRRMGGYFFTASFPTPCVLLIPCLLRLPFVWHFQGIYIHQFLLWRINGFQTNRQWTSPQIVVPKDIKSIVSKIKTTCSVSAATRLKS